MGGRDPLTPAAGDGLLRCRLPELVAHATPHLPAGLLDGPAVQALGRLPAALPAAGSIGAFECRLESDAGQIDFEVCIRADGGGRAALAAGLDGLAALAAADDGWARTVAFARAWADPRSVLFDAVSAIWLEFDLDPSQTVPATPFVVVTLDPRLAFAEGGAGPTTRRAIGEALAVLADGSLDRAAGAHLAHCLRELPPGGRLLHIAVRPDAGTRLLRVITAQPWRETPRYLGHLGWSGDTDHLAAWLARTCPASHLHSLNFDLLPEVGPRIGVEYHFPTPTAADPRWQLVLDALQQAGACSAERRAQITAWPSHGEGSRRLLRVDRELLLKVVHQPGAPLRAKAYLPFCARLHLPIGDPDAAPAAQCVQRPGA